MCIRVQVFYLDIYFLNLFRIRVSVYMVYVLNLFTRFEQFKAKNKIKVKCICLLTGPLIVVNSSHNKSDSINLDGSEGYNLKHQKRIILMKSYQN